MMNNEDAQQIARWLQRKLALTHDELALAHEIGLQAAGLWRIPPAWVRVECDPTHGGVLWVATVRGLSQGLSECGGTRAEALTHLRDALRETTGEATDFASDLGEPFADVVELRREPSLAEGLAHQLLAHDPADVLPAIERYLIHAAALARNEPAVALYTSAAASLATLRDQHTRKGKP